MSNIENLLRRQYEGVITPDEQSELERLTHRDQVIEAATRRAKVLRRRQLAGVTGVASVLLVAGVIFFVNPSVGEMKKDKPMIAKTEIPEIITPKVAAPEPTPSVASVKTNIVESDKPFLDKVEPALKSPVVRQDSTPVVVSETEQSILNDKADDIQPTIISDSEPIVACNTACSPDSVINDIWKFLRT